MNPLHPLRLLQRRTFLGQSLRGVGSLALTSLFHPALFAAAKDEKLEPNLARARIGDQGAS